MKREVQKTGVRKWHGDDLIALQSEPLRALDAIVGQYGNCIVSGCGVTSKGNSRYDIGSGMVAIDTIDVESGAQKVMIMPFAGVAGVALPVYLVADVDVIEKPYGDGGVKPVAYDYRAIATAIKPTGSGITIGANGGARLLDVMQDAAHRLVSDVEKAAWNGKAAAGHTHGTATTTAPGFMAVGDKTKLDGVAENANNYVHPNDASTRHVSDAEKAEWNAKPGTAVATPEAAGLMAAADKGKLDGVAENANNYVHPNDASTRHVTDAQVTAWDAKATTALASKSNNGLMSAVEKLKLELCIEMIHWGVVNAAGQRVAGSKQWESARNGGIDGHYKVTRSNYYDNTLTIVTGRDGSYASIIEDTPSYFIVKTADDASPNNSSFSFITFRFPNY